MPTPRICATGRYLTNPDWDGWMEPCEAGIAYWTRIRDGRKRLTVFFCAQHKQQLGDRLGHGRFRPV